MAPNRCVLLAASHHGLSEAVRRLLATMFDAIVMVADEVSLFESASRLQSELIVVDLTLSRDDAFGLLHRLRRSFPNLKIIVVSKYDSASVSRSVLAAGAHAFVVKSAISTDLLAAADSVLAGKCYVSSGVA